MGHDNIFPDQSRARAIKGQKTRRTIANNVEQFKLQNKIQVNCISDQTYLYIRYILAKFEKWKNQELDPKFKKLIDEVYHETRGSNFEIDIPVPSSLAGAIIIIAANIYSAEYNKGKRVMIQKDISDILLVRNDRTVSLAKRKLDKFFSEKNIRFGLGDNNDDVSMS